jgi:hypothetical protein
VQGWLIWDLVTSLPFDRILCFAEAGGQGYVRFIKILRLLKATPPPPHPACICVYVLVCVCVCARACICVSNNAREQDL